MDIPDRLQPWLEKAMDLAYRRHHALAGNLANVDTPNYQPVDLEFQDHLKAELGAPSAEGGAEPVVSARPGSEPGLDGNKVDLDEEIVRLNSNKLFYELASETVNRRLALLKYAIDDGGR